MTERIYDAFMLDHASGSLDEALALAAELHVSMNSSGREIADIWDMVGGAMLERDLAETTQAARRPNKRRGCATAQDIFETDLQSLSWRRSFSGAEVARFPVAGTHFMRLGPNQSVPAHSHSAIEATVVLSGTLEIDGRWYRVGDIAFGEPGEVHKPAVGGNEPCVCFVAREKTHFWRLT